MKKSNTVSIFVLLLTAAFAFCACAAPVPAASSAPTESSAAAESSAPAAEHTASAAEHSSAPAESSAPAAAPVEVIVFAAASMTETLNEIADIYKVEAPDVSLVYNFDSSGTLKTQIQEGADCDLFISAAQKQMNALDITQDAEKNPDRLDFVVEGTRVNLLENKVTLVVPQGNPAGIKSFEEMVKGLKDGSILMAVGNSDVPVGQYTQKILDYFKLSEEELAQAGVLTYGTNVKEVTTQVSEGSVDCGIIYATDAFSTGLDVVAEATPEMCGQVIYPAAVINSGSQPEAALEFLKFLQTAPCMEIFESVGFSPVTQ